MPISTSPNPKHFHWRIDGVLLDARTFETGKVALRVEITEPEAADLLAVCRVLVDRKSGRVVECQMPIEEFHDRLCVSVWGEPPTGFEIPPIGSLVRLVVSLSPYPGKYGWRVTAFPFELKVITPAERVPAYKPKPKPSLARYEPRAPGPRHQGIPAPDAPEPAAGSVSQRAVLAILPKPGLVRASKPGSMPRPVPGLQPGRRRELYAAPTRR